MAIINNKIYNNNNSLESELIEALNWYNIG